jgi:hypothetical protein
MEEIRNENEELEQQEEVVEEFLEPTPYRNKYKRDLDKDDEQDSATVQKDTDALDEDADATPDKERPETAEERVFKKRYDDLKRHYDTTVLKFKDEVSKLKEQLVSGVQEFKPPKDKNELSAWRQKYPDVYDIIKTIAIEEADQKAKLVETKLRSLEDAQIEVSLQKAEVELAKLHPDYKEIRGSDEFHDWAKEQDDTIQNWLYSNNSNAKLAARAIDLYKIDKGITAKKETKVDLKDAAKSVTATNKGNNIGTTQKKVWTVQEIQRLKPSEFVKYEKDIDLARREGRIK